MKSTCIFLIWQPTAVTAAMSTTHPDACSKGCNHHHKEVKPWLEFLCIKDAELNLYGNAEVVLYFISVASASTNFNIQQHYQNSIGTSTNSSLTIYWLTQWLFQLI